MKKKFAKSIIFSALIASFATSVMAQEDLLSLIEVGSESTTKESASKEIAEHIVGSNNEVGVKKSEMSEVDKLDNLTTLVTQGSLELQILNQQLERKKLESILKEDDFKKRLEQSMEAIAAQFKKKEDDYLSQISSLQQDLRKQRISNAEAINAQKRQANEMTRTENNVFVTNIIGVGSNLTATVYYEDKTFEIREGMQLSDDISVMQILSNGVVFNDGKKETFVALTNEDYAFSQTYNKSAIKMMEANTLQGQRSSVVSSKNK